MIRAINYFFFLLTICFCHFISLAQQHKIDSLQQILTTAKADTTKVKALNQLSRELYLRGNYDTALIHAGNAKQLAETLNFRKGIAGSYNNIGNVYYSQGNYPEALKNYFAALKIRQEIGDKRGIAASYNNIGNVYYSQGNYPEALKNHFAALKIREEIGDKQGIGMSYNNIGNVYYSQGNYPEALKNHFASLKIREEIRDIQGIATSYNNIGLIYYSQGNYPEAQKNYFASLEISQKIGDKQGIADSYNNIGNVYYNQGNYPEALKNHFASLKIKEEIGDKWGIGISYNNIGRIYNSQGNYPEALKNYFAALKIKQEIRDRQGIAISYNNIGDVYTVTGKAQEGKEWQEKALKFSKEIGYKDGIKDSYAGLAKADSILATSPFLRLRSGQVTPLQRVELAMSALENYKMYVLYKDSLINEESIKKLEREKNKYEYGQEEAKAEAERQRQAAIAEAERRKQQIILWFVIAGLLLVSLFAGFVYRSYRQKQKANTIITQQKAEVEKQKKVVEEKNKDILDSIHYAKRIQDALLKAEEHVSEHLPEHFVLFMPKDIVSGDFYWTYEKNLPSPIGEGQPVLSEVEGGVRYWYVAAVDCTGHGVPGAFMSMLGMSFLNDIVSSNSWLSAAEATPAEILNQLRDKVVKELRQTGETGGSKDGMDISLVRLKLTQGAEPVEVQWAGANNALNIIQNGELLEIKADKQPIGYHPEPKPFTNHEIQIKKGDSIYIFSDGYADQFGGPKGKKFKYKQLEDLLLANNHLPMDEQKIILKKTFTDWRGALEQVDDVCVIGVRV